MAEGFSRTLQAGSDTDNEVVCTPCEEDSKCQRAVHYCPTCDQYLCAMCSYHTRFQATKGHSVSKVPSVGQHVTKNVMTVPKCPIHPDRNIEMYCGQHNMVYCALCIATDHRTCTGVSEVNDASEFKIDSSQLQTLLKKVDLLLSKVHNSKERKQRNIGQLTDTGKEIVEKIEAECEDLKQHIDKLQEAAISALSNKLEKILTEVTTEMNEASNMEKSLQNYRSQIASSENLPKGQRFIRQIVGQHILSNAESLLTSLDSYGRKQIKVDVNETLHDCVLKATYIALPRYKIILQNSSNTGPTVEGIIDVNVKVQGDYDRCKIIGITQLPDGTILICDNNNKKLKRLDQHWQVRDYCPLDSAPWGICCTGTNEVAVKLLDSYVQFISVGTTLLKTRNIEISSGGVLGIECISSELWVSQSYGINVYSMSGSLVKSNIVPLGTTFAACPQEIAGTDDENVYVSGCQNKIICLDKEGSLKAVFRDKCLRWTRGVCVMNDDIVCAAGFDSNNIVIFRTTDGECLGELAGAAEGIQEPLTLCFDNKGSNLIVGCNDNNMIKVISVDK